MKANFSRWVNTNLLGAGSESISRLASHLRTPLYRNGYALVAASAATSGLGFLYWILAARLYSPEVVGLNSAAISAMLFLSGVAQLSLNGVLVRFIPVAGKGVFRLILTSYLVNLLLVIPACIIFYLGLSGWSPSLKLLLGSPASLVLFLISTMGWSIFSLQDSALTGLRQTLWIPLENTIYAILKIVLLFFFAATLPMSGIFASWVVPSMLLLIPVNWLIYMQRAAGRISGSSSSSGSHLGEIRRYITGNYLGSLFFLAYTNLLPVMVIEMAGARANAYFYLPWTIISSLQLVALNMTTSLTVEAAREQEKLAEYVHRVLAHTLKIIGPAVIILLLGANVILSIFGKPYAEQGANLLRLMSLAVIPHLVISMYISIARVKNRALGIVLVQGSLSILVLGLSYILIPRFGINGVGIAWLPAYALVAGILYLTQLSPMLKKRMDA